MTALRPIVIPAISFPPFAEPLVGEAVAAVEEPVEEPEEASKLDVLVALWELEKLEELDRPEELDKLEELDELKELVVLRELDKLEELDEVEGLDELGEIDKREDFDEPDAALAEAVSCAVAVGLKDDPRAGITGLPSRPHPPAVDDGQAGVVTCEAEAE